MCLCSVAAEVAVVVVVVVAVRLHGSDHVIVYTKPTTRGLLIFWMAGGDHNQHQAYMATWGFRADYTSRNPLLGCACCFRL